MLQAERDSLTAYKEERAAIIEEIKVRLYCMILLID
jgi:hypothetical protein